MRIRTRAGACRGQATTELTIILPIFLGLAGVCVAVVYMCWQGIKVEQAAMFAARVQGQERVAGGKSGDDINDININGVAGKAGPDTVPDIDNSVPVITSAGNTLDPQVQPAYRHVQPAHSKILYGQEKDASLSVFQKIVAKTRALFGPEAQDHLYFPKISFGNVVDEVRIVRIFEPPSIFGFRFKPIKTEAVAYGGEDCYQYSLPRWGHVGRGSGTNATDPGASNNLDDQFWKEAIRVYEP